MPPAGPVKSPEHESEIFLCPVDNIQEKRFMHKSGQDHLHVDLSWCKLLPLSTHVQFAALVAALKSPSSPVKMASEKRYLWLK
jgi:hypothetical protein